MWRSDVLPPILYVSFVIFKEEWDMYWDMRQHQNSMKTTNHSFIA